MKRKFIVFPRKDTAEWRFWEPATDTWYNKSWWRGYLHAFKLSCQGHEVEVVE